MPINNNKTAPKHNNRYPFYYTKQTFIYTHNETYNPPHFYMLYIHTLSINIIPRYNKNILCIHLKCILYYINIFILTSSRTIIDDCSSRNKHVGPNSVYFIKTIITAHIHSIPTTAALRFLDTNRMIAVQEQNKENTQKRTHFCQHETHYAKEKLRK